MATSSGGRRNPSFNNVLAHKALATKPLLLLRVMTQATLSKAAKRKGGDSLMEAPLDKQGTSKAINPDAAWLEEAAKDNSKCKPKYLQIPRYEVTSTLISQQIKFMQDHAIICKFIRL